MIRPFMKDRFDIDGTAYERGDLNKIIEDFSGQGAYSLSPFEHGEYAFVVEGMHTVYGTETRDVFLELDKNRRITGVFIQPTINVLPYIAVTVNDSINTESWDNEGENSHLIRYTLKGGRRVTLITPNKENGMYMLLFMWR